ncbi:MAG: VIT domain-containing protein [bacterium]
MMKRMCCVVTLFVLLITVRELGAIGRLYGRIPNWENSPVYNLRIKSFDVTVTIQEQLAVTHIDEVFANENWRRLEGIYILELPEGAKLTEMYLWINGERIKQEIKTREEAVEIFEEIVRRQTDPLLAEEIEENVFRFRLFPIEGFSERRIEIKYINVLPYDSGQITYLFPMDISDFEEDAVERGSIKINLRSQFPFTSVSAPSYPDPPANMITQISPTEYEIIFGNENFIPSRDYDLLFSVERDGIFNVLTFSPPDSIMEDSFYLLWVTPPDSIFSDTSGVRNVILVADVSSSMEGSKLQVLKEALIYFVRQLKPTDRFNVIAFSTSVTQYQSDLVTATPGNVQEAVNVISSLAALGLTNFEAALTTALNQSFDPDARNSIILITDGVPNQGVTDAVSLLSLIRDENSSDVAIFPIGIGDEVDRELLRAIATENSGAAFFEQVESFAEKLPQISQRIASPILKEMSLTYGPAFTYDRYPMEFANLASGGQLVLAGRFFGANVFDLALSGVSGNKSFSLSEQVAFPDTGTNHFVSRIWAAKKINFLIEQIDE